MKKLTRIATPLIAVAMMTVPMMALAQSSQGNAAQSTTTNAGSINPEAQASQSYADGVQSATIDMAAKRVLDPQKSYRYLHPPVKKGPERDAYLANFSAGYTAHVKATTPSGE